MAIAIAGMLLVAAATCVAWLLMSQSGSTWLVRFIEARSAGRLSIAGVSGTFSDEIILSQIRLELVGASIDIDRLAIDVDLSGILARALVIEDAKAGRIAYRETDGGPSSQQSAELPVLILLRRARADAVSVETGVRMIDLGITTLEARYVDGSLEIRQLATTFDGFALTGRLDYSSAGALDVDACIRGQYQNEEIDVCTRLDGIAPELRVSGTLESPFAATYAGTVLFGDMPELSLDIDWSGATLSSLPDLYSNAASLRIRGPVDRLSVAGQGAVRYAGIAAEFDVRLLVAESRILVEDLTLSNVDTEITANGDVYVDGPVARLSLIGSHIDPSVVASGWSGDLDLRGNLEIVYGDQPIYSLSDLTLGGELRGYPLVATGGVRYSDSTLQLMDVTIVSRTDRIALAGAVGDALDLAVDIDVSDLGLIWPNLVGSVGGSAVITGTTDQPQARGTVEFRDVEYEDYAADRATVSGVGGLGFDSELAVVVSVDGLHRGNLHADQVVARILGTAGQHQIALSAETDRWALDGSARGSLAELEWQGTLESLTVRPGTLLPWELDQPAGLSVGPSGVLIEPNCLVRELSRLCVEASLIGESDDRLRLSAQRFDIAFLAPLFPEALDASGIYELDMSLSDLSANARGTLSLRSTGSAISYVVSEQEIIGYALNAVQLDANLADRELSLVGSLQSGQAGSVALRLDIENIEDVRSPVTGEIQIEWTDTALLSLVSPEVGDVSGSIAVNMSLGGSLADPEASGQAIWSDGALEVPNWGLFVDGIEATIASPGDGNLNFIASGNVDDAVLEIAGQTVMAPEESWPTRLSVRGEALRIVELQDVEVFISPDLIVDARFPRIAVSGKVEIPRAELSLVALPEQAVVPSSDAVIHGRAPVAELRPLDFIADIELNLGDDVRYNGTNLEALLTGALSLNYESGRPATARGTLSISGEYNAYGNPLTLDGGELVFAGPWDNPALDVRASRAIGDTTVGVQMTGTLQAPETRIFSMPEMSEADALSYLMFGRPLVAADNAESVSLGSAAVAMGLRQAVPVIQRIGTSLGFDELTVRPTNEDAGALMAGKYLSPKLYIRYSYGLFNRIGGLLLRYRINDRLSVETQSGDQKAMDLLYTIEKD